MVQQPSMASRVGVLACLALRRLFDRGALRRFGVRNEGLAESAERNVTTRVADIPKYWDLFRPFTPFAGRRVIELGCSRGYLLAAFLELEPFSAIGVDINAEALAAGRETYDPRITFVQSTATAIPLPESSADIVYTIDTIEHLSDPLAMLGECHRVLRPGGLMFVQFHPWLGPYGAHLGDVLNFPWPHVLFSMETLYATAARVYDSPDYTLPWYHQDPTTGERRPNPYLTGVGDYLNFLTIRGFRRLLRRLPFEVAHFERIGFGGTTVRSARLLRPLAQVRGLDEFFTHGVFVVLSPMGGSPTRPSLAAREGAQSVPP